MTNRAILTGAALLLLAPAASAQDMPLSQILIDGEGWKKAGRIYAAPPLGIQVFDPTGRLCGVITAPPGRVELLGFEGDRLTAWVGDTKYARKLKTTGVR